MPRITPAQMGGNHVAGAVVCVGCGASLARVEAGDEEHRPDCTSHPSALMCEDCDAIRLPSEPKSPAWRYDPNTRTYHCPTHQKGTTP